MTAQAMEALARANEIRCEGADFRRHIAQMDYLEGCEELAAVIEQGDFSPGVGALKVELALSAIHRIGPRRVVRLRQQAVMGRHGVRLRNLTAAERMRLVAALRASGVWATRQRAAA